MKVLVLLPNHWATGGESMWARPLGSDLYELRNVPFYAYGLNFLDVVRAVEPSPEKKPVVSELVRPSGHRTLRVIFFDVLPEPERPELLRSLADFRASFECANPGHFAIDIEPDGDYGGVCDRLTDWEEQGILNYETCEARAESGFDDVSQAD